jgi:hypothetical protein
MEASPDAALALGPDDLSVAGSSEAGAGAAGEAAGKDVAAKLLPGGMEIPIADISRNNGSCATSLAEMYNCDC